MLINWFTVAAQVVNFLILLYLLKRFLYRPILGAMEERERRIASAMEEATKAEEAARQKARPLKDPDRALSGWVWFAAARSCQFLLREL